MKGEDDIEIAEPTQEEVDEILSNMKINISEIIMYADKELKQNIYNKLIWKNGDQIKCNNYRGIALLDVR